MGWDEGGENWDEGAWQGESTVQNPQANDAGSTISSLGPSASQVAPAGYRWTQSLIPEEGPASNVTASTEATRTVSALRARAERWSDAGHASAESSGVSGMRLPGSLSGPRMCRLVKKQETLDFVGDDESTKLLELEVVVTAESNEESSSLLSCRQSVQAAGDDESTRLTELKVVVTAETAEQGPYHDCLEPSFSSNNSVGYVEIPIGGSYPPVLVICTIFHTLLLRRSSEMRRISSDESLACPLSAVIFSFIIGFTLFFLSCGSPGIASFPEF